MFLAKLVKNENPFFPSRTWLDNHWLTDDIADMNLFNLSHFPVCHSGGITRISKSEYRSVGPGVFENIGTKEKIDLYQSIKKSMSQSIDQVFFNFSHWTWMSQIQLTIGNILRLSIPVPAGYSIFAVPLPTAIMGNVEEGEHCFPSLFLIDESTVLIGTTAHKTEKNPVGKIFDNLVLTVFCYESRDKAGWMRILYSSLSNLAQGNTNTAVLLLATALELYSDYLLHKYLEKKIVTQKLIENVTHSAKAWRQKADRVALILETIMPGFDKPAFNKDLEQYRQKVRDPRNAYVHEHSTDLSKPAAHEAFCAAFELLWKYDQLDEILLQN